MDYVLLHDDGEGMQEVAFEVIGGGRYAEVTINNLGDFVFAKESGVNLALVLGVIGVVAAAGVAIVFLGGGGGKKSGSGTPASKAPTANAAPAKAPQKPTAQKPQNGNNKG